MMTEQYMVSARKYRPSTFDSVVGQESLTKTLKNAIIKGQLAHAYLFCGPRGVGKTTCARIFAKTINCFNLSESGEACNKCESCISFNKQRSLNIFELDAASNNSVNDIRELINQVMITPQIGKYRVYIIDEVHMLTTQAFNAFLKTLEEPPDYAIFILATTEKHKILPTIISRCQVYDFNRIQVNDTVEYLKKIAIKEGVEVDEPVLDIIAQNADGAMRDALSNFDQLVSFSGKKITYKDAFSVFNILDYNYYFKLINMSLQGDIFSSLIVLDEIINKGFDISNFLSGLSTHVRDLLVARNENTLVLLNVNPEIKKQYISQSNSAPIEFLIEALNIISKCELNYKSSKNKRLLVELMLIQMCQILTTEERLKKKDNSTIKKISPSTVEARNVVVETSSGNHAKKIIEREYEAEVSKENSVSDDAIPAEKTVKKEEPISSSAQQREHHNTDSNTRSGILNLNNILEEDSESKEEIIEPEDESYYDLQDFTEEQLIEAWHKLAEHFQSNTFFVKHIEDITPVKEYDKCVINIVNEQQLKEFFSKKVQIEQLLGTSLHNKNITLVIKKNIVAKERQLSPDDVYKEMITKNSKLEDLLNQLDLEVDY